MLGLVTLRVGYKECIPNVLLGFVFAVVLGNGGIDAINVNAIWRLIINAEIEVTASEGNGARAWVFSCFFCVGGKIVNDHTTF